MRLTKLYSCKHCTEGFVGALEHWKDYFNCQDDDYAHEIVQVFEDKIHELNCKLARQEKNIESKYQDLCDLIVGDSPNWTHDEMLSRCAQQVDALIAAENKQEDV